MKNARSEARAAFNARSEVEVELGALKQWRSSLKISVSSCTTLK